MTSDWSDLVNPNGAWACREGANPVLFNDGAWQGLATVFSAAQPAWTTSLTKISSLPAFFKSSAPVVITHDWLPGDVVVHTQDDANGLGFGAANISWVSPIHGTVNIIGAVWMGRDIGRSNHWSMWVRGAKVTEGDIASGDAYSEINPFDITAGSGGAAVLTGVAVNVGDEIELLLERASQYGDFVGVRLAVNASSVAAVPPSTLIPGLWLGSPMPNPVRSGSSLRFRLPVESRVALAIHDATGRRVRGLEQAIFSAGDHSTHWDGCDDRERAVFPGVYFARLEVGGEVRTRRVVVLD